MKKTLCITGTRADFGKLKPLLHYLETSLELHLIVTGMHMLEQYGHTYLEVKREGFHHMHFLNNQTLEDYSSTVTANSIQLFTQIVHRVKPDLIIVHGDRIEALAGAIVGALENILVCHIEGGELSGTIDDSIRHAISKLAHIHMVANQTAQQHLIQMGENPEHIYIIGSPDLDVMQSSSLPSLLESKQHYDIPFDKYAISLFHPVTTEYSRMTNYARDYFSALEKSGDNYIVIYPNNDLGGHYIIKEIEKLRRRNSTHFRCFPSIRFEHFLTLLKNSRFIIGNSSAGIREAPFYGIPSINVGTRQNNRATAPSIINCDYDVASILQAIALGKTMHAHAPNTAFGQGNSTELFARIIKSAQFWNTPIQKQFYTIKKR